MSDHTFTKINLCFKRRGDSTTLHLCVCLTADLQQAGRFAWPLLHRLPVVSCFGCRVGETRSHTEANRNTLSWKEGYFGSLAILMVSDPTLKFKKLFSAAAV